jgi:hypothetical protein
MKVLELKGPKSLCALNVFSTLMLGLKMLPAYMTESYEDFLSRIELMPPADQEKMIREALQFVNLKPEEIEGICCFATDVNGVPYSSVNLKNASMQDIFEIIVTVCMEVAKIPINFVTDSEKKKSKTSQSTSEGSSQSTQH